MMHAENGMAIDVVAAQTVDGRHDRPVLPRRSPASRSSRARRRTASSAWPRRPACPVYIVHLSSRDALAEVRAARDRGSKAFAETCPQYLFLSLDDLGNGFEGAKFVCSPPLRPKDHWDDLWTGLVKDDLQVVSTDHCPFDFHGQKELGRGDFRKIPNGLPGVEDRVDLLHDGGVVGRPDHAASAGSRSSRPRRPGCSGCTRGRARSRSAPTPTSWSTTRAATRTISADDPPHGRRLLVLRGPERAGRVATSSCRAARSSSATASSPGGKGHGRFIKRAPADFARLS